MLDPAEEIVSEREDRPEGITQNISAQTTKMENRKGRFKSHKEWKSKTCLLRVTEKEQEERRCSKKY